ncbi:uncharacterized protein EI90DRAFT_3120147 [Cantharellus anzutake]|uniref:uncharacterized protein n=1 Tax=Cantharellus anzutake TaxID=1750568 RepID=UPI0019042D93|nr:uncharacterized protein EI90DRAFT_3120147 [Cantharellus anzutake]KAF8335903.1 hypothetical protein EI90DRAFT_3120147 [Cantharellus anzutake]
MSDPQPLNVASTMPDESVIRQRNIAEGTHDTSTLLANSSHDSNDISTSSPPQEVEVAATALPEPSKELPLTAAPPQVIPTVGQQPNFGIVGWMFSPYRPTNPNIFHTITSILLYPTIFEDLYRSALKSDIVGILRILTSTASIWELYLTSAIYSILSVLR